MKVFETVVNERWVMVNKQRKMSIPTVAGNLEMHFV